MERVESLIEMGLRAEVEDGLDETRTKGGFVGWNWDETWRRRERWGHWRRKVRGGNICDDEMIVCTRMIFRQVGHFILSIWGEWDQIQAKGSPNGRLNLSS